jgi:CHAT domain-containing protein
MLLIGSWPLARRVLILLLLALALCSSPAGAVESAGATRRFDEGLAAYDRGALEDAVSSWAEASELYTQEGNVAGLVRTLIYLSRAYTSLGRSGEAISRLTAALELAERANDLPRVAAALAELGNAHLAGGSLDAAGTYLRRGLDVAAELGDAGLTAVMQNNLGNLLATQEKHAEAVAAYRESADLAKRAGLLALVGRALVNAAVVSRRGGEPQQSRGFLEAAFDQLRDLPPSHDTAVALISAGLACRDLRPLLPDSADALLLQASGAFRDAGAMAEQSGDRRTVSYAWGYLGGLYEDERRDQEALALTRRAMLAAQQASAPESLYRWQWQSGRLLSRLGMTDEAIAAYRRAVQVLQSIRPELSAGDGTTRSSFRESAGRVYFELVDLLLRRAASVPNPKDVTPYLLEARDAVELFKAAELRDYFRDDCVDAFLAKATRLDVVSRTAVVVYPILLPDRIELLVSLPGGLKRVMVPVGAEAVTREVREFRLLLEKRTTRQYLPHAQQLYRWLIAPIEADLAAAGADTLIFVPDGPLRTIPMSALHDGKQFLIARYAIGITPGLDLTDPRPLRRERMKVLVAGVTESVQGFAPLPGVGAELEAVRGLFRTESLMDREFQVANLAAKLKDPELTVVHIASHGRFGSDVGGTFLLAFDEKLTMDRLNQLIGTFKFREEPLELLTLSACDTAAGDDRAALGLAGVAIKAGARSALATLWHINDPVTARLVAEFYRQLKDPAVSRAAALQRAQLQLIADPRYAHPGFWSPFLLINNWL